MSSQQLCHHMDQLEEQLQLSQQSSLSPAVVFPSGQILVPVCCSSSRVERQRYVDQSLHHRSWVSGSLWRAEWDEDALGLDRKDITKHVKASKTRCCVASTKFDPEVSEKASTSTHLQHCHRLLRVCGTDL